MKETLHFLFNLRRKGKGPHKLKFFHFLSKKRNHFQQAIYFVGFKEGYLAITINNIALVLKSAEFCLEFEKQKLIQLKTSNESHRE